MVIDVAVEKDGEVVIRFFLSIHNVSPRVAQAAVISVACAVLSCCGDRPERSALEKLKT